MNGCKSSCITLAAIAGASAAIAGGILAVSSATAESGPIAGQTIATRMSEQFQADRTVDNGVNTSQSVTVEPNQAQITEIVEDTFDGMRRQMRFNMISRVTEEFLSKTAAPTFRNNNDVARGTPVCDTCEMGSQHEQDVLLTTDMTYPQGGSGLPDACQINAVADVGWRGANDHCGQDGQTDFNDPNLLEDLGVFTAVNQSISVCGTMMNIDQSLHTGDSMGRAPDEDYDVWGFRIGDGAGPLADPAALTMRMTINGEIDGLRAIMTFNFFVFGDTGEYGQITQCSDGYGIFNQPVWDSIEARTTNNCGDDVWEETLAGNGAYWYILMTPLNTVDGGPDPATGCPRSAAQTIDETDITLSPTNSFYYNLTLESIDPIGACCNTDTGMCAEGQTYTGCLGNPDGTGTPGVFFGGSSTCADQACCSPITELGATPADWEEDNQGTYGSESEDRCNESGATNLNEGCVQDFFGTNLLKEAASQLSVAGNPFTPADICDAAGDQEYWIVGYSGTEDNFSSSFATDSIGFEDDVFQFELGSDQRVFVEFNVPFTYVGYILGNLGGPQGGSFTNTDCTVVSFNFAGQGVTPGCNKARTQQCLPAGQHGIMMQQFVGSNVSCNVRYTIKAICLPCLPGSCCFPNGTCVDGLTTPECETDMGGNFGGEWSSCCATSCTPECTETEVNPPTSTTSASADDNCEDYTCANDPGGPTGCPFDDVTVTGDTFNSGFEPPDGMQAAYWSLCHNNDGGAGNNTGGTVDRLWCGRSGIYILDQSAQTPPGVVDFEGDFDYYELDTTDAGMGNDTQLTITVLAQSGVTVYLGRERARSEAPTQGADGSDDLRDLSNTQSFVAASGVQTSATFCLPPDQHILLIEPNFIVPCGNYYTIQLDFEPDCQAACCTKTGCEMTTASSALGSTDDVQECATFQGVYRGLGTWCPTTYTGSNPLGRDPEIDCCSIACEMGDIVDNDNVSEGGPGCDTIVFSNPGLASDPNGGCVQGPGTFQDLGTIIVPAGATGSTPISVCGTTGALTRTLGMQTVTRRDRDFYTFTVSGSEAELDFFIENDFLENIRILDPDDLDPGVNCNTGTQEPTSLTINSTTCNQVGGEQAGQTFIRSGLLVQGESACLDEQTHYIFIEPNGVPECDRGYRFSVTLYECRLGCCCLDNSLCIGDNDVGYRECTGLLGGTFLEGESCPTGSGPMGEGTLCIGLCCIDDDMMPGTPTVCQSDTRYQDCCLANGALAQSDADAPDFAQGGFFGYTSLQADNPPSSDCMDPSNDGLCDVVGACCVDSASGYMCSELSMADCASASGNYAGDGTSCAADDPCDPGACCILGVCSQDSSPLACAGLGGTYQGDGNNDCGSITCPVADTGACCFAASATPPAQGCTESLTEAACEADNGVWIGVGTTCVDCGNYCLGDLNSSGGNDVFDFNIFAPNFGIMSGATRCDGDLDGDGDIDVFDFNLYAPDFGCTGVSAGNCP